MKKEDEVQIIPYNDPKELEQFLNQPNVKIAEALTGLLSLGKSDVIQVGGRLVQAVLKKQAFTQLGREIKQLTERGKIKEDYANTRYGFQSLSDTLTFIDSEAPDQDRLMAVKSMFYNAISIDTNKSDELLKYQLLKLTMKLEASQLLLLKVSYDLYKQGKTTSESGLSSNIESWFILMAKALGHGVTALVLTDEAVLMDNHLLNQHTSGGGIHVHNYRLTDLGIKLCQYLEKFSPEISDN